MTRWLWGAAGFGAGAGLGAALALLWSARERSREGRLISFVLHELNTPLTSLHMTVLNFLQGIFGPVSKDHEAWLRVLKEQTARLGYLLGDLRDLAHMEFQRDLKFHPEPVSIESVLREVLSQMETSLARGGVGVELQLEAGLPDAKADKDQLPRIINAVLSNARKFQSGGRVFVSLRQPPPEPRSAARSIELAISYQGPKLSASEAERMLELFYPVAPRRGSATLPCVGIGLGFCRVLLERQGGRLFLEVDGKGLSRIRARLPVASV